MRELVPAGMQSSAGRRSATPRPMTLLAALLARSASTYLSSPRRQSAGIARTHAYEGRAKWLAKVPTTTANVASAEW